jgi:hypothetical protein
MALPALELVRELDRQKLAILQQAGDEALDRASEALKELRQLVGEQLKIDMTCQPKRPDKSGRS